MLSLYLCTCCTDGRVGKDVEPVFITCCTDGRVGKDVESVFMYLLCSWEGRYM